MSNSAWPPTTSEFKKWLQDCGLPAPSGLAASLTVAVRQFESDSGFSPFVARQAESQHWFTPSDYMTTLDFEGGFVSVSEVGYSSTPGGDVTALTELTDFVLEPFDEGFYRGLKWVWGARDYGPKSIRVTGRRGRCQIGTDDASNAREAVFNLAAYLSEPKTSKGDGPVKRLKQGPMEVEYGLGQGQTQAEGFLAAYGLILAVYRRVVV